MSQEPHFDRYSRLSVDGWQGVDDEHPAGGGVPGYRLAYKTLKLIPSTPIELSSPDLRITFGIRKFERGSLVVKRTVPTREADVFILPEYLNPLKRDGEELSISGKTDFFIEVTGTEEELDTGVYVEFLLKTRAQDPAGILNEGRHTLAKTKALIDFVGGRRVLGVPITEEVGHLFDDWHWNRQAKAASLRLESELDMQLLDSPELVEKLSSALDSQVDYHPTLKQRIALACDWYWRADGEGDPVSQFLQLWFAVEALEMPKSSNIKPVKKRLASITDTDESIWSRPVGMLYRLRGRLVHGEQLTVGLEELDLLRLLLAVLIEDRLLPETQSSLRNELIQRVRSVHLDHEQPGTDG